MLWLALIENFTIAWNDEARFIDSFHDKERKWEEKFFLFVFLST